MRIIVTLIFSLKLKTCKNTTNKCILRENTKLQMKAFLKISDYLKVPKLNTDLGNSQIKTCEECWKISEPLNQLCIELELVKIEISHYLIQLSGQIIQKDNKNLVTQLDCQVELSNFQNTFHAKCKLKLLFLLLASHILK